MKTQELFSLKNKVALITGGRSMYGKGATIALVDGKAKVYLATHSPDRVQSTVDELNERGDGEVVPVVMNQKYPESIKAMVDKVVEKEGRIDVFVNASRMLTGGPVGWEQEEEFLNETVKVNSTGFLYMSMLVGEQMIKQKSGSIINFGSMMGLIGVEKNNYAGVEWMAEGAYSHDYPLNKSGITSWTRHAASFYGRFGIRVNTVCPGGLESDRTPKKFMSNYSKHTQLGRLANKQDITGIIALLASDASAYLTGLNIPVDGGYTAI